MGENRSKWNMDGFALSACPGLKSITVALDSTHYRSADGVLYTEDGNVLLFCPYKKPGTLSVPKSVSFFAAP